MKNSPENYYFYIPEKGTVKAELNPVAAEFSRGRHGTGIGSDEY
jgi:hypothetical protein